LAAEGRRIDRWLSYPRSADKEYAERVEKAVKALKAKK